MRCHQFWGLRPGVGDWLDKNCKKLIISTLKCPKCGAVIEERKRLISIVYYSEDVWYGEELHLHEYELEKGGKIREVIQAQPWSSGPVTFLCLEYEDGRKKFQWPKKDIEQC